MFEKKLAENPLVSVLHRNPKIQDDQRCPVLTASVPTLAWTGMKREGIFRDFDPSVKAKIQTEKDDSCRRAGFCPEDPRLGSQIRPLLSSTLLMWTLPPDLAFRAALIQALSARWTSAKQPRSFVLRMKKKKKKHTPRFPPFFQTIQWKTKQNKTFQFKLTEGYLPVDLFAMVSGYSIFTFSYSLCHFLGTF